MNSAKYSIRAANRSDINAWSRLRTELWPDTDDGHVQEIEQYFAGTSNDIEIVYVAEIDTAIVGFIEINVRNYAEGSSNPKVPYIEGWLVDQAHQGCGVGRALMAQAEQWAVQNGYTELASDAELDNEGSIATHQRLGFEETERIVCFLKKLK